MEADPAEEACGELIPGGEGDIDVLGGILVSRITLMAAPSAKTN
jgi:hypothetical protein